MDQRRAAAALLALAACFACSTAAPTTTSNQTALDFYDGPVAVEGCYYNFQHYGEGDRIMTNEPCLNCTCHNRMLMCYLRVCPFTKPIGQDCTVEKRADQCCPIVTCPDVPVDLLTSTSTTSPAEYGATGLGKLDKYGCSINGKYFPEGSKVPPAPNKPCEHCYCIRNMTTCVMQECTLHVDGCTPIYHKDVCCPIRYSCDHEDEIPLLDDMTTTVRPTPGFLLTTTTMMPVTQPSQECVHDDQIFPDGALIKTEKACEHCYCMKGDIVCVVQECGTPMENEGKNCVSLPPRQGQCCPDTYICEGDETPTTEFYEETTTLKPPRRVGVEGSGYRNEPDEPYTGMPLLDTDVEGSGEDQIITTVENSYESTPSKGVPESTSEFIPIYSTQSDKDLSTVQDRTTDEDEQDKTHNIFTTVVPSSSPDSSAKVDDEVTLQPEHKPSIPIHDDSATKIQDETTLTLEISSTSEIAKTTVSEVTTKPNVAMSTLDNMTPFDEGFILATKLPDRTESTDSKSDEAIPTMKPSATEEPSLDTDIRTTTKNVLSNEYTTISTPYITEKPNEMETTPINVHENEIAEDLTPGRIPGEGDCLLNGLTYKNNTVVPTTSKCHSSCKCLSSIIKCEPIICALPQEYMNDCYPVYDSPESCCPTYVCNTKETSAPESHSQMSGTEAPKPTIECVGDECKLNEEGKPIIDEKPVNNECGENGCSDLDLSQKDSESCNNGKCETDKVQHPIIKNEPCDSDKGCQVPATMPCVGESCKTEFVTPIQKEIDLPEKPINEDEEILCKEENCRRKEHGSVDQKLDCSGSDCLDQGTVASTVIPEISTEISQLNEITTKSDTEDKYVSHVTDDSNAIQDLSTLKPQISVDQTLPEEQTTRAPITTTFEISQETQDYSREEIKTQPTASYEATTENIQQTISETANQNMEPTESVSDKLNSPNIAEVENKDTVVTESSAYTVEDTPEKAENPSTEYNTHSDVYLTTSKVESDLTDATKQITTEPNIASDTTKPSLIPIDTTTASQRDEISHDEQGPITEIPENTELPSLEKQTTIQDEFEDISTKIPMLIVTERDEIITEKTDSQTVLDEKITNEKDTEIAKDVTEPIERTTTRLDTELIHSTTSSDSIITISDKDTSAHETTTIVTEREQHTQETTSVKESLDIHETTTIYSEVTKQNDLNVDISNPEISTPKEEKTLETSSTEDYPKEGTEYYKETTNNPLEYTTSSLLQRVSEKDTENLKDNELISTVLPEIYTKQEESKTTPSSHEQSDITITPIDDKTTSKTEIHNDYPTNLSTESDLYMIPSHSTTENTAYKQETTLSDRYDQQNEIISDTTTSKEALMDEITKSDTDSDAMTTAYVTNYAEADSIPTESAVNKEVTTMKPIESTYSQEPIETIDSAKTTAAYSDTEITELMTDSESPVISDLPKSTSPASYTEPTKEITTLMTPIGNDEENKGNDIATEYPTEISSEADITTESYESSVEPEKHVYDTDHVSTKPADSEISQTSSDSTTTPKEELNASVLDEMPTTDKHIKDEERITSTDKIDLPMTSDIHTEKPEPTEASGLVTSQIPDLRDRPDSTEEHTQEIVTENIMAEITNIPIIKEKETETPMSLVTESQSASEPHKVAENENLVTETNIIASTKPHDFSTESSLETTIMDASFVSQQSSNENITPESPISTGYDYPKPTTESLKDDISTINVVAIDNGVPSDISTEKNTIKETTHYYDETSLLTSTTSEKPELADDNKPNIPITSKVDEVPSVTELGDVEKEITSTSDYIEENVTKVPEEITVMSIDTGATESHKDIESSEKTTQYSQSSTAEAQDVTEKIEPTTAQTLLQSTEITPVEIQTPHTEDTSNIKITSAETTPSSPSIIYSTDSSQKETAYEPETMTEISETIADSAVTEAIDHEHDITQTETSVTKFEIPPQSSTETHPETETEHNIEATNTQFEDNQAATTTTESADLEVTISSEDKTEEAVSSDDGGKKPTHVESITPTTEHVSDTKLVEPETTTEVKLEFSETTPYFVELEEHTHQIVQETTVIPAGEYSTEEVTNVKTTERGDQMLTEILIDDSQTEKSNEVTTESSETHLPSQFIEEQTSQEKDQTTSFAASYGTTTMSALQPENETDVKVEKRPIDDTTTESNIIQNEERVTTISDIEKPSEFDTKLVGTTKAPEATTLDQEKLTTKPTTPEMIYETTSVPPMKSTIAEEKLTEIASTTSKPLSSKAPFSDIQPTEELPTPDFPPSGYDQEPDYAEEDQAFGPGTCRYGGKVYVSAQQIPRDDPCDFCFCFRSDIICLQQSCPPPIHGCHEEPIQGFCCPRYECPVSMATSVNVTTTTTTTTTTLPPHFLPHAYKGAAQRKGCHIKGHSYKVGEVVRASSGPCLHCTCGGDGQMKCDPKACTPEPMLRQMIAAAVSAKRRR